MSVIHADNNFIPINNNSHLKSVTETRSDARSHSVLNLFSCQHVLNHTSIVHFPQIGVCVSELHGSRAERANAPFTLAVWSSTKARPVYCPKYPIKSWEINYHQKGCMQTGRSHKKMWASPVSGQMTKQVLPFPVGQLVTNGTDSFDSFQTPCWYNWQERRGQWGIQWEALMWGFEPSVSPGVMGRQNSPVSSTTVWKAVCKSRSSREWHAGLNSVPLTGLGCCWESKASYSPLKTFRECEAMPMPWAVISCFQYWDSSRLGIWEETRS